MTRPLQGKKIAFLFTEGVEQAELIEPLHAIEAAGGESALISLDGGVVQMFNHNDRGDRIEAEHAVADVDADDFDGLVLPGGVANPDALRTDQAAVGFTRSFFDQGKPVGVICHGPWTLIEAGVVRGRTLTSWPSLQTDLRNAGANWVDEQVHVDGDLVSSRKPDDLPAFCEKLVAAFSQRSREYRQVA
jgi:protease I